MGKVGFISPAGITVQFNLDSIVVTEPDNVRTLSYHEASSTQFDDIFVETHVGARYKHVGATINVDGATFAVIMKENKDSMKFFIDSEPHHIDHDLSGLLGYTMKQGYKITGDHKLAIGDADNLEFHDDG